MIFKSFCKASKTAVIELTLEGDYESDSSEVSEEITVPFKWEVCPQCQGDGHHSNPTLDGNGITQSEMEDLGEDFRENYFAGVYDVTCEQCHGNKLIPEIDLDLIPANDPRLTLIKQAMEHEKEVARDEAEWKAEQAKERRMLGDY